MLGSADLGLLPARMEVRRVFDEWRDGSIRSSHTVIDALVGSKALWWECCQEAVRKDPAWLRGQEAINYRSWINEFAITSESLSGIADPAYLVAEALSMAPDIVASSGASLELIAETWENSRLLIAPTAGAGLLSGRDLTGIDIELRRRLDGVVGTQQPASSAGGMVSLTALLLAGASRRNGPVVRIPVVFGQDDSLDDEGAELGVAGVLELRTFPAGPIGLFPDPQHMAGAFSTSTAFAVSLQTAWTLSPWLKRGRCVLWRVILVDEPALPIRIDGGSLGAAFALGLCELFRHPTTRRPNLAFLRTLFYGLRSKTAVTGVVSSDGRLSQVSAMGKKLHVAHRKRWRLVAPEANRPDVVQKSDSTIVSFAATLKQADRYARRWRIARLATTVAMILTATATGLLISRHDASSAERQNTVNNLVNASSRLLNGNADLAQLFAVEAYREEDSPQTRQALFNAVTSSPSLVRYLPVGAPVSAIGASSDGHVLVAGTDDGRVLRWDTAGGAVTEIAHVRGSVRVLSVDTVGDVIGIATQADAFVWTSKFGAHPASGQFVEYGDIAVSPSGNYVALTSSKLAGQSTSDPQGMIQLTDRRTGVSTAVAAYISPGRLALPSDSELIDTGVDGWERDSLPDLKREVLSPVSLMGVHGAIPTSSSNGHYFTFTNGGRTLPIWSTAKPADTQKVPDLIGMSHGDAPQALAISNDGSRVAVADGGTIYVDQTGATGPGSQPQEALTGNAVISALVFIDNDRLLSASGSSLTLWDLGQISRITEQKNITVNAGCSGCGPPQIALRPDGKAVAVVDGSGYAITVHAMTGETDQTVIGGTQLLGSYGLLGWSADSRQLFITTPDDTLEVHAAGPGLPLIEKWPITSASVATGDDIPRNAQVLHDLHGHIELFDPAKGSIVRLFTPPGDSLGKVLFAPDGREVGAVSYGSGGLGNLTIIDTATGVERTVGSGVIESFTLSDDHLLIQRQDASLEIWNAAGTFRQGTIIQNASYISRSEPATAGSLVAQQGSDGTIVITGLDSGRALGTMRLPERTVALKTGLAMSTDAGHLITVTESTSDFTANNDGILASTSLTPATWVIAACLSAGRNLTADEWRNYIGSAPPSNLACTR